MSVFQSSLQETKSSQVKSIFIMMFKDPTNSNNLKVHISFCCPVANKGLSGKKKVNSVFTEELNQLLIN